MTLASTDTSAASFAGPELATPDQAEPDPSYRRPGRVQLALLAEQKVWQMGTDTWSINVPAPSLGAVQTARATDLFLSSLGFCLGDLVMSYCQHKQYPVQGITMTLTDHPEQQPLRIARIGVELALDADLTAEQRAGIASIIERHCKIGNTIRKSVDVTVTVSADGPLPPTDGPPSVTETAPASAATETDESPTIKCSC